MLRTETDLDKFKVGKSLIDTIMAPNGTYSNRLQNTLSFVRGLASPDFMKDEEILTWTDSGKERATAQVHVQPNIGNTPEGKPVKTTGWIDLITKNKTSGQITNWDLKANLNQEDETGGFRQLGFYALDDQRRPDNIGIIAYNDKNGLFSSRPITQEDTKTAYDFARDMLEARFQIAEHGDSWDYVHNKYPAFRASATEEKELQEKHDASRDVINKQTGVAM